MPPTDVVAFDDAPPTRSNSGRRRLATPPVPSRRDELQAELDRLDVAVDQPGPPLVDDEPDPTPLDPEFDAPPTTTEERPVEFAHDDEPVVAEVVDDRERPSSRRELELAAATEQRIALVQYRAEHLSKQAIDAAGLTARFAVPALLGSAALAVVLVVLAAAVTVALKILGMAL